MGGDAVGQETGVRAETSVEVRRAAAAEFGEGLEVDGELERAILGDALPSEARAGGRASGVVGVGLDVQGGDITRLVERTALDVNVIEARVRREIKAALGFIIHAEASEASEGLRGGRGAFGAHEGRPGGLVVGLTDRGSDIEIRRVFLVAEHGAQEGRGVGRVASDRAAGRKGAFVCVVA